MRVNLISKESSTGRTGCPTPATSRGTLRVVADGVGPKDHNGADTGQETHEKWRAFYKEAHQRAFYEEGHQSGPAAWVLEAVAHPVGPRHVAALLWLVCSLYLRYGVRVQKPTAPEQLFIDFDGFFAACEEQADRRLQGRPLGVIPFARAVHSCVIAANTMAKRAGVTTGMAIADARRRCPGIALVPQQPDLYTRVHHRIVAAVLDVLPIDAVCSIDELAATVAPRDVPAALTHQIKQRLRDAVGDHITCSIGYAPNRWLAKIAADLDKPDGLTVLHPQDLPGRLLTLELEDLPGVATRMRTRLARWGLTSVEDLWQADPLQLRAAWGSVTGTRLWYALHGYAVALPRTPCRSIGHGRVLPPGQRQAPAARILARQLVVKAARCMRRAGYLAQRLTLSVDCLDAPRWTSGGGSRHRE